MKLENEVLSVEIAELGAEVTGISDREKNTDILWEGNPSFWKRHSPVLFPNVGKTYGNEVLIEGNKFPTVQHGFARDSVFTCVSSSADAASFRLASSEETKKVYPYDFELYITYTLKGKNLKVEWKVKNCSEKTMYFTIGGHPAFRFAEKEEKKEDYLLKFPGKESLTYLLVDPNTGTGVPDQTYTLELTDGMCPVTEEMFLRDALIFDGGQFEEVWLCRKDGTPYVGMRCEGFPNFGIWSVKDAPFVCLEPWEGRCDNFGFAEEISKKPGIIRLPKNEVFIKSYEIILA